MAHLNRHLARFLTLAASVVICACCAADASALPAPTESTESATPVLQQAKDRDAGSRSLLRGQEREGASQLRPIDFDAGAAGAWHQAAAAEHHLHRLVGAAGLFRCDLARRTLSALPQFPLPPPAR